MIPLRDSIRAGRFPLVNITLIVINAVVFFQQAAMSQEELLQLFYHYGVIPQRIVETPVSAGVPETWFPFITAIFLHGSWFHLLSNMLFLWVFGDNIEDRLGRVGYLFFYLAAGVAASTAHIIADPSSAVPVIGASGAIAGVLGMYFILFPRAKVLTLIPIGFFLTTANVSAKFFLILWLILQILNALILAGSNAQAVAWWAHIGGFLFGAAAGTVALLWRKKVTI